MWPADRVVEGALHIFIGVQRVECGVRVDGRWSPESLSEERIGEGREGLVEAMSAIASRLHAVHDKSHGPRPPITSVHVLVADNWLPVAGIPWSTALARPRDADAFIRGQLAAAGYEVAAADVVRIEDSAFGHPRVAVAYPAPLVEQLTRLAHDLGARVASVLPLSVAAWAWTPRVSAGRVHALAVQDEGLLLLAQGSAHLTEVTVRAAVVAESPETDTDLPLRELWQREQLRDPQLARAERLPVLRLAASISQGQAVEHPLALVELPPQAADETASARLQFAALCAQRRSAIDAIPQSPRMTNARWAMAGVAMALAGAMLTYAAMANQQVRLLDQQLAAVPKQAGLAPRATSWSREELARVQAVNGAIRELNLPIAALLRSLQPPRDIRVAVLSIDASNAQAGGVKIVAEARTAAEMARYVGFVADRKPFAAAYLTRHEIVETTQEKPYRFTVEANLAQ